MIAGDDLRLCLCDVEGSAVQFGGHPGNEHEEGQRLDQEEGYGLGSHDVAQRHRAGDQNHSQQRQHHWHFVAEQHRNCPPGAEERVPVVGRPPGGEYRDGGQRTDGQHEENPNVQIHQRHVLGEREHGGAQEHGGHHDDRHGSEREFVGAVGNDVLFGDEFGQVRNRLERAEGSPPVGAHAILEPAQEPALTPTDDRCAQQHRVDQDQHDDQAGDEVAQPAGSDVGHRVVDEIKKRVAAQHSIGAEHPFGVGHAPHYRSTSPMFMSTLPRDTIMSASFQPRSRCSVIVKLIREGERILQR